MELAIHRITLMVTTASTLLSTSLCTYASSCVWANLALNVKTAITRKYDQVIDYGTNASMVSEILFIQFPYNHVCSHF